MDRSAAIQRLKPHLGQHVILQFTDGEEIEVQLVGIDEREEDCTFVVRSVRSKSASGSLYTVVGTTYIAPFVDLIDMQPLQPHH